MYEEIKSVLYESNGVFIKKEDKEQFGNSSINRSLRLGKRISSYEKPSNNMLMISEKKEGNRDIDKKG